MSPRRYPASAATPFVREQLVVRGVLRSMVITRRLVFLAWVIAGVSACTEGREQGQRLPRQASPTAVAEDAPRECDRRPVEHEREDVKGVAFARGEGPVFVGLGTAGAIRYTIDTKAHKGWHYYKTLWAIAPEYEGTVTVTGFQLNGANELRFNASAGFPGEKLSALEFEPSDDAEWRYGPSDTLIRADGCYALRIQGEDFVDWVTFVARS